MLESWVLHRHEGFHEALSSGANQEGGSLGIQYKAAEQERVLMEIAETYMDYVTSASDRLGLAFA